MQKPPRGKPSKLKVIAQSNLSKQEKNEGFRPEIAVNHNLE
jgi:hypothetical protein